MTVNYDRDCWFLDCNSISVHNMILEMRSLILPASSNHIELERMQENKGRNVGNKTQIFIWMWDHAYMPVSPRLCMFTEQQIAGDVFKAFPLSSWRLDQELSYSCLQVLSRLGHMSYDVVAAQILQTGIPPSKVNIIGTTEVAVASLAESAMLGVAIIANDVSHFGFLATLSLLSVVGAAWMFCRWLLNPTDEQRSLFSFDARC